MYNVRTLSIKYSRIVNTVRTHWSTRRWLQVCVINSWVNWRVLIGCCWWHVTLTTSGGSGFWPETQTCVLSAELELGFISSAHFLCWTERAFFSLWFYPQLFSTCVFRVWTFLWDFVFKFPSHLKLVSVFVMVSVWLCCITFLTFCTDINRTYYIINLHWSLLLT